MRGQKNDAVPQSPVGMQGRHIQGAIAGRLPRADTGTKKARRDAVAKELGPIANTTLPSGHTTRLHSVGVNDKHGFIHWVSTVHDKQGKKVGSYTATVGRGGVSLRTHSWANDKVRGLGLDRAIKQHIGHRQSPTKSSPRQWDLQGWTPAAAAASLVAACHSKACAPPPVGKGGSNSGGGAGGFHTPAPKGSVPSRNYGMTYQPGSERMVAKARKVSDKDWDTLPVQSLPHGTKLIANEEHLTKPQAIERVVSGKEPFREGYVTKLWKDGKGNLHIVDGHHRVAMYHELGKDMPVRIMSEKEYRTIRQTQKSRAMRATSLDEAGMSPRRGQGLFGR